VASEEVVPAATDQPAETGQSPLETTVAPRLTSLTFRRILARAGGARLVYGKPVRVGNRTVIPVARVFTAGGFGFGSGVQSADASGEGGGGGGVVDARPVGYIEVDKDGSRYVAIPDPDRPLRIMKMALALITTIGGTAAGRRAAGAAGAAMKRGREVRPRRGARRRPSPPRSRKR
jgi:uncharacterized spore protein YtfJ